MAEARADGALNVSFLPHCSSISGHQLGQLLQLTACQGAKMNETATALGKFTETYANQC